MNVWRKSKINRFMVMKIELENFKIVFLEIFINYVVKFIEV